MTDASLPETTTTAGTGFDELPDAPPIRKPKLTILGKLAVFIVVFWIVVGFICPWIAPYDEGEFILDYDIFTVPGETCMDESGELVDPEAVPAGTELRCSFHLLGTDHLGRDLLSRIFFGARTTIGIAFLATVICYLLGVPLGVIAAVCGGYIDLALSRANDALISIPTIMIALVVIAAIGSTIPILIIVAAVTHAPIPFRISRALGLDIMVSDYVEAAKVRGEGLWWVVLKEIAPNVYMPLTADFGIRVVYIILFISGLSFLGLGVQPPIADWGSMVKENLAGLTYGSIAPLSPAFAIATFTISINIIIDDISAEAGGKLAKSMVK